MKEGIFMKKIVAGVLALLVLTTMLCACGGSGSIVGKWVFGGNTYQFNEDNSVSISINGTLNFDGTYEVSGNKITLNVSGMLGDKTEELTYSLKGDTLKLEGDVSLSGSDVSLEFTRVK